MFMCKMKQFLAMFLAVAIVFLGSPVVVSGNPSVANIQMGAPDVDDGADWRQMRWHIGAEEEDGIRTEHRISMADFADATQLLLEFSAAPVSTIYMILFGDGNDWNFGDAQHVVFDPDDDVFTSPIVVELNDFPTFADVLTGYNAGLILASTCLPATFVSAQLVLGADFYVPPTGVSNITWAMYAMLAIFAVSAVSWGVVLLKKQKAK
jgi:outer membrane lipoprotein-sorting protein